MEYKIDDNLKKALLNDHFEYEFRRMREIFLYMLNEGIRNKNQIITENFVLVAFLTHIRNLYEFFYKPGNIDWASAEHYISEWKSKRKLPENIKNYNIRINHFLSHLSYRRVDTEFKPYEIDILYKHFEEILKYFFSLLPEKYKTPKIIKLLEDLK